MKLKTLNFLKLSLVNNLIFVLFLSVCIADNENDQIHSSADFFKVSSIPYAKLNQIDNRIKDVKNDIKGLKSDIKKVDEKLDKLQKNYEATIQTQNLMYNRLLDQEGKLNQIIQNTKPKSSNLRYDNMDLIRKHIGNQRSLVERSISSDDKDSQYDFLNQFIQGVYNWQNRTDLKLSKMMNVITEIYKEDKQLSTDLSRLNERQVNEEGTGLVEKMRKEFKEQFSINKAELKNFISNVNENCLKTITKSDNLTFLMLGIRDDLNTGYLTKPAKFNHNENSVLPPDEESSLLFSKAMKDSICDNTIKLINSTVEQFKVDLANTRLQILNRIDKENAELNDRLYILNNNYQNLNNLKNCNASLIRSVDQYRTNKNEVDASQQASSMSTTSTFVPPPFYSSYSNRGSQFVNIRSKSSTRIKLISPIKNEQKNTMNCNIPDLMAPSNCDQLYEAKANCDGVYVITLQQAPVRVYCEMDSGSGSTVIMRRGQFNDYELTKFNRNWKDYKQGFGTIDADFWLGLDNIHELTKNKDQQLIIDLESFNGDQLR